MITVEHTLSSPDFPDWSCRIISTPEGNVLVIQIAGTWGIESPASGYYPDCPDTYKPLRHEVRYCEPIAVGELIEKIKFNNAGVKINVRRYPQ